MKTIYLVRHCASTGQSPDAELSNLGFQQANDLILLFDNIEVGNIISSPFLRAQDSIKPTAQEKKLKIQLDERLAERTLSTSDLPNWLELLEQTFMDIDLKLTGGESSREATARAIEVVNEAPNNSVLVTHGNLISLILKYYDDTFGFHQWKSLSNPDVYSLMIGNEESRTSRIWQVKSHTSQ